MGSSWIDRTRPVRRAVWGRLTERFPALATYERRAGRTVPVFRLAEG